MQKNTKIISLIITSVIIIGLISIMIALINISDNNSYNLFNYNFSEREVKDLLKEETYENTFETIKIKAYPAKVEIKKSENNKIKVMVYAEKNNAEIETSEKELYIDVTSKKCNIACFNRKISKIELYIPENYDKELKIEGTSGDIKISEFKNMNVEINQSSGDTEITNVKNAIINASSGDIKIDTIIENAELKTSSGDITADKIGIANLKTSSGDIELKEAQTASITTTSGDIKVNTIEESAELETTSGDITANKITNAKIKTSSGEIELGNVKEYIEAETSSGDIKIDDLEITKDSKIEARSGDVTIHKTNDIYTETKTSSGNSKIENNNRKSEITLKIETSSGDIKVK